MGLRFSFSKPCRSVKNGAACLLFATAGVLFTQPAAHAQLPKISAVYTLASGIYNYNFSVQNLTAFTLADVNVLFPTGIIATNLSAPTDFQIVFDPNGNGTNKGIVDFLPGSNPAKDFFAGTTVSGFLFRTTANLNGATFGALDVNGTQYSGTVTTSAAAPEPGTLGLLAFGMAPAATFVAIRRRRFSSSAPLKG